MRAQVERRDHIRCFLADRRPLPNQPGAVEAGDDLMTELRDVVSEEPVVVVAVETLSTSLSSASLFCLLLPPPPPFLGSSSASLLSHEEEEEPPEPPPEDEEELELVLAVRFRRCRRFRFLEGSQQSQK